MIARATGKVGGKQVKLTLEATLQEPTPGGGHIQLAFKVESGKEGDPVANEEVVFSRQVEGKFDDVPAVLDHEGRAGYMFRDFGLGQHTLKARYDTVTVSVTIPIGEEKLQYVAEVDPCRIVQGGIHTLSVTAFSEKKLGIPGWRVRVFDSLSPIAVVDPDALRHIETTTDASGVVSRVYEEDVVERKVTFDFVGTKHIVDFTIPASPAARERIAKEEAAAAKAKEDNERSPQGPSLRERMRTQFQRGRASRSEGGTR